MQRLKVFIQCRFDQNPIWKLRLLSAEQRRTNNTLSLVRTSTRYHDCNAGANAGSYRGWIYSETIAGWILRTEGLFCGKSYTLPGPPAHTRQDIDESLS